MITEYLVNENSSMRSAKYKDLEGGETDKLTRIEEEEEVTKVEYCWWCMILCPIMMVIGICIGLTCVIIHQYQLKSEMDNKEDFNDVWIILSALGIVICGCPLVCQALKLIVGYMCHPGDKKEVQSGHV